MGCIVVLIALFSPRLAVVLMWIFTPWVDRAFGPIIWPILGIIFLPLWLQTVGGASALAFGGLSLAFSPIPAAILGVAVYAFVIYGIRSYGLTEAWAYVRRLH